MTYYYKKLYTYQLFFLLIACFHSQPGIGIENRNHKLDSLILLAKNASLHDLVLAEQYSMDALDYAENIGSDSELAFTLRLCGAIQMRRGNYDEAEKLVVRSIGIQQDFGNSSLTNPGDPHSLLGSIYLSKHSYAQAIESYLIAKRYYDNSLDTLRRSIVSFNLGIAYKNLTDYNSAFEYFGHSILLKTLLNDSVGVARSIVQHSVVKIENGDLNNVDSVKSNLDYAIKIFKKYDRPFDECLALLSAASYFIEYGTVSESEQATLKFKEIFNSVNGAPSMNAWNVILEGNLLQKKKEYRESILLYDSLLESMKYVESNKGLKCRILKNKSECHEMLREDSLAYSSLLKHHGLRDSLLSISNILNIGRAEHRYIGTQNSQNSNFSLSQIVFFVIIIIGIILGFVIRNQKKSNAVPLTSEYKSTESAPYYFLKNNKELSHPTDYPLSQIEKGNNMGHISKKDSENEFNEINDNFIKNECPELIKNELSLQKVLTNQDWSNFQLRFNKAFPGYLHNVKRNHRKVTPAELRMIAFIKLGLINKDIANAQGISYNSVKTTRYRLRKKLGLQKDSCLDSYIISF